MLLRAIILVAALARAVELDWIAQFSVEDKTFTAAGDVVFSWTGTAGTHNVEKMASFDAWESCDFSGATLVGESSGATASGDDGETAYYACSVSSHCDWGQKVAVTFEAPPGVPSAAPTSAAPSGAPTTAVPTGAPSTPPTTASPSAGPSASPSSPAPSASPSSPAPSAPPSSRAPSAPPSSRAPSEAPTAGPTPAYPEPTSTTYAPSAAPSAEPSGHPSPSPSSAAPTPEQPAPTAYEQPAPTAYAPSAAPAPEPTAATTPAPTAEPAGTPTLYAPSPRPTSEAPSLAPSYAPSAPSAPPSPAPSHEYPPTAPPTTFYRPSPGPTVYRPSGAPTAPPTAATWHKANSPWKDCAWVAAYPPRCDALGEDGTLAYASCGVEACGGTTTPSQAPTKTYVPPTAAPSAAPVVLDWVAQFSVSDKTTAVDAHRRLVFAWTGDHNVEQMASRDHWEACDFAGARLVSNASGAVAAGAAGSTSFYACSVGKHCTFGQKVAVDWTQPVPAPTACADRDDWYKKAQPWKDCPWVAALLPSRCEAKGDDDTYAWEACRVTCGCTAPPSRAPTPARPPATPAPTPRPARVFAPGAKTPEPSLWPTYGAVEVDSVDAEVTYRGNVNKKAAPRAEVEGAYLGSFFGVCVLLLVAVRLLGLHARRRNFVDREAPPPKRDSDPATPAKAVACAVGTSTSPADRKAAALQSLNDWRDDGSGSLGLPPPPEAAPLTPDDDVFQLDMTIADDDDAVDEDVLGGFDQSSPASSPRNPVAQARVARPAPRFDDDLDDGAGDHDLLDLGKADAPAATPPPGLAPISIDDLPKFDASEPLHAPDSPFDDDGPTASIRGSMTAFERHIAASSPKNKNLA